MKVIIHNKKRVENLIIYCSAFFSCMSILFLIMKLWKLDIRIPLGYGGDALFSGLFIKSIIDNGWFFNNSFVGMPFGLELFDFPTSDLFNYLIIKIVSLFENNWAITLNIFFLLTFPLTTFSAVYTFRSFKISPLLSIFGGLIYTFVPYHFMRGVSHLFLAAYYIIPLVVMVIFWIIDKDSFIQIEKGKKAKVVVVNKNLFISSIIVSILVSATGTYYAFFSCAFIFVAGTFATIRWRKMNHLLISLILTGIICVGLIINVSPSIIYNQIHGRNSEIALRNPIEAEVYGLKITQLLLPVSGHRIDYFNAIKEKYNRNGVLINENDMSSLGFISSIGFLILIASLFLRYNHKPEFLIIKKLSILNIFAILLATIGGFSTIFATLISPQIRAYNRISIFIAFFGIFTVVSLLNYIFRIRVTTTKMKSIFYLIIFAVLLFGIFDQTTEHFIPPYEALKVEYNSDKEFIKKIEDSLPRKSIIFQLPYIPFPENPPVYKMVDYDLLKGYLNSQNLYWSYPSMKGREGDLWLKYVNQKPLNELLDTIIFAGFNGLYIDCNGYEDSGISIKKEFIGLLGYDPIISQNGRLAFFDLTQYTSRLKREYSKEQWELKKENALHPIIVSWEGGFSTLEGTVNNNWRWCSDNGTLIINNMSNKEKEIFIDMEISTGYNELSGLIISSDLFNENIISVNANGTKHSKRLVIPYGKYTINFSCDAKRVNAPGDPRDLVFRVINFMLVEKV